MRQGGGAEGGGTEVERLIHRVYAFPPAVVAKMVDAISNKERAPPR